MNVEKSPDTLLEVLSHPEFSKILAKKAEAKDVNWFVLLYKKLSAIFKANDKNAELIKTSKIILTNSFELSEALKVLLPTKSIPLGLEHTFKLIHLDFMGYPDVLEFFRLCGAQEVTSELIKQLMTEKQIPEIARMWDLTDDKEKIEKIHFIFSMWEKEKIKTDALSFLTLKSKEDKWEKPKKLKFGDEYSPEINFERIIKHVHEQMDKFSVRSQKRHNAKIEK